MKIKELADLTGTTVWAIRHYHHIGLLPVPTNRGVRDYDLDHAVRLVRIRALAESGIALTAIKEILDESSGNLEAQCAAAEAEIDARITELQLQKQRLATIRANTDPAEFRVNRSPRLDEFYRQVYARTDDSIHPLVDMERRAAEVVVGIPSLGLVLEGWLSNMSVARLEATADLYALFAELPQVSESEAEALISTGLERYHDTFDHSWGLSPTEWSLAVARMLRIPGLSKLLFSVFPHPHHRMCIQRFLEHMDSHTTKDVSRETSEKAEA
ncbi:MerR family transcriptional regulator [Corynebacterium breve]|uniref:MerR family transcriptional regulator n=1 Tax=Corynebacterium breve TaxID=3049799 RepID=A0ABY8VJB8_9CORY|nr:MerR family transcriptional regulator [Corynebacterium breve]WIM67670.1 MerR family transcriptional regulator [Corynebacterium breve]